jgi:hypothetical protein
MLNEDNIENTNIMLNENNIENLNIISNDCSLNNIGKPFDNGKTCYSPCYPKNYKYAKKLTFDQNNDESVYVKHNGYNENFCITPKYMDDDGNEQYSTSCRMNKDSLPLYNENNITLDYGNNFILFNKNNFLLYNDNNKNNYINVDNNDSIQYILKNMESCKNYLMHVYDIESQYDLTNWLKKTNEDIIIKKKVVDCANKAFKLNNHNPYTNIDNYINKLYNVLHRKWIKQYIKIALPYVKTRSNNIIKFTTGEKEDSQKMKKEKVLEKKILFIQNYLLNLNYISHVSQKFINKKKIPWKSLMTKTNLLLFNKYFKKKFEIMIKRENF